MDIVILDGYTENPGDLDWEGMASMGRLTVHDRTPPERIVERIGKAEIVIVNKAPMTRETMMACRGIRYIGMLATGYNVVDVVAAREFGIIVSNIPTYGTQAVAQFAIAMLLEICHHVGDHADSVQKGQWTKSLDFCYWNSPLIELAGKTMGVIGFGRIGQATARIAQALGMSVLAYDELQNPAIESDALHYTSLEELLRDSDVISLHCPLTPSTQGLIRKETLDRMKNGVILLNNARGALVVEADLAEALDSGKVYAAGLDVVSIEPIRADNPLLKARNCMITPHISWAPRESRSRLMDIAVDNLRCFIAGTPVNVVN
jgi:glycerate dehydrogenase